MNPEELREYHKLRKRDWRARNCIPATFLSEEEKKKKRKKRNATPAARLAAASYNLKYNYGITPENRDRIIETQDGYCANPFCDVKLLEEGKSKDHFFIHVDHDHITKQVRGIMCRPCNTDLGRVEKDPLRIKGLLQLAEKYQNIREEFLQHERRIIKNL